MLDRAIGAALTLILVPTVHPITIRIETPESSIDKLHIGVEEPKADSGPTITFVALIFTAGVGRVRPRQHQLIRAE
jgi:hypothetical protein